MKNAVRTTISYIDTPIGCVCVTEDQSQVVAVRVEPRKKPEHISSAAAKELKEYFAGKRTSFDLPLQVQATPFQKQVLSCVQKIPYGSTRTYKDIAESISKPSAARAVGNALNKNPLLILIPCHRVLPSSGKIGGFAYGSASKQWLLAHENSSK